jgi:hypothetical protein
VPSAFSKRLSALLLTGAVLALGSASLGAPPVEAFEVTDFDGLFEDKDRSATTQASSHPFQVVASFDVNTIERQNGEVVPEESVKDIRVELPPGLVGNPTAVPRCTHGELAGVEGFAECPPDAQVGVADVRLAFLGSTIEPSLGIFNLQPRPGAPAEFGINLLSVPILLRASVRTGSDYGLDLNLSDAPQGLAVIGSTFRFWGVPADPAHTRERGFDENGTDCSDSSDAAACNHEFTSAIRPFLTMPAACTPLPVATTLRLNSWEHPERVQTRIFAGHDSASPPNSVNLGGCNDPRLTLRPALRIKPTTGEAASASGLDVELELPAKADPAVASDLYVESNSDAAIAAPPLHTAVVKLPRGLTLNPAVARGLSACTQAEIELDGPGPGHCPDGSKIGGAEVTTPLLDHPLRGAIYIARQRDNKFGSLLAVYVALNDPAAGVTIKLAGRVDSNGSDGQLTARFDDSPQLPFSKLRLSFFGGSGGAFITPEACGGYEGSGEFSSWSAADPANPSAAEIKRASSSFTVDRGAGGRSCAGEFAPTLSAGTTTPAAGTFSPFVLRVSRGDGSQQISSVTATLPRGLLARLAGVPYCAEAALASISSQEGAGALQAAQPSCPRQSQVGTASVAVGAGDPLFVNAGKAYLAGPYKGAPLSLAVVVPALAGPFDLGNVVVRVALRIDPESAQITASSDPIPAFLHGIPLDVRSLSIDLDRPQFILNPTSCAPTTVGAGATSLQGTTRALSQRFQVGGCSALAFAPKLSLKLTGKTRRGGHPALRARLDNSAGGKFANLAGASVSLPAGEILDQAHLTQVCTRVQFDANRCPAQSIYGYAKAVSPLLDAPLEGSVYLRTSGDARRALPDLVADLKGQIRIALVGRIDSVKQRLRTTFLSIPDAPITRFDLSLKGGKRGLIVNSTNLCAKANKATVKFSSQAGAAKTSHPIVSNGCGKPKRR